MNTKKVASIFIAIAFVVVLIFSCAGILTVQKIDVDYKVLSYSNTNTENSSKTSENIQESLDKYVGNSIVFLNIEQMKETISEHPLVQLVSIEKQYPNRVKVVLQERREVYKVDDVENNKTYILDENGYVLADDGSTFQGNSLIGLDFENISIISAEVGKKIQIESDENGQMLKNVFDAAIKAGLTDCIKNLKLRDLTASQYDLYFMTNTGVEIQVFDIMNADEVQIDQDAFTLKVEKAFSIYDEKASDYQKRFGTIISHFIEKEGSCFLAIDYSDPLYGDTTLLEQPLNS
ncbi:MAG: FtsQ-type POTRA domain-containing protein [Clostridiales bacterium]|nr:FtsQ-type POTRA domain-containing protein [Clostridiales bacterium]